MKKLLLILSTLTLTLALTSCTVNWFGETREAPWYVIAIPVVLILVIGYIIIMSKTFICPKCNTEFKPKWYQLSATLHYMDTRVGKCPKCGYKGFCKVKKYK